MSLLPTGAAKIAEIAAATDPKQGILKAVGDLSKIEVLSDLVLLGTYIRHEKINNIYRPDVKEDEHQGKVGLVLKTGALAYSEWEDDAARGQNAIPGTWVVFHIRDTAPLQLNGAPVRLIPYEKIRMRVADPALIF